MQHSDTLLTIAELAVALAGFASLVSVIGGRRDKVSRGQNQSRLQWMLELGLRNAAFAVIPLPFVEAGYSDPTIWRSMSGLYILAMIGHFFLLRQRHQGRQLLLGASRSLGISSAGLFTISAAVSILNVFGMGGSNAFSLYIASLVLGLGYAGLLFVSVASSVFHDDST